MHVSGLLRARMRPASQVLAPAIQSHIARKLCSLPKGFSDSIMTQTLELHHNIIATIISCYASKMNSTAQEKDDFYNIPNVIIYVQHKLILMGDFSARVDNDHLIDYIITKKRDLRDTSITCSLPITCGLSDHALFRSKASFRLSHGRLQKTSVPNCIITPAFKVTRKQSENRGKYGTALNALKITNNIKSSWKTLLPF